MLMIFLLKSIYLTKLRAYQKAIKAYQKFLRRIKETFPPKHVS